MNKICLDFANADLSTALSMVRCGFELETQATLGMRACELFDHLNTRLRSEAYDMAALDKATKERQAQELARPDLVQRMLNTYGPVSHGIAALMVQTVPSMSEVIRVLVSSGNWEALQQFFEQVLGREPDLEFLSRLPGWKETLINWAAANSRIDRRLYLREEFKNLSTEQIQCRILLGNAATHLDVGEDGSVSGVEIRTLGPLTYDQFLTQLAAAFSVDHRIDRRCSFHLHLSLADVNHSYSGTMQRAAVEWLAKNADQMPLSVRERFADADWVKRYYRLFSEDDKYTAVSFRGCRETWEFRLFGNVANAADGEQCLKLAVQALQHAYKQAADGGAIHHQTYNSNSYQDYLLGSLRGPIAAILPQSEDDEDDMPYSPVMDLAVNGAPIGWVSQQDLYQSLTSQLFATPPAIQGSVSEDDF